MIVNLPLFDRHVFPTETPGPEHRLYLDTQVSDLVVRSHVYDRVSGKIFPVSWSSYKEIWVESVFLVYHRFNEQEYYNNTLTLKASRTAFFPGYQRSKSAIREYARSLSPLSS